MLRSLPTASCEVYQAPSAEADAASQSIPVLPGKGKGEDPGNLTGDDGAGTLSAAGFLQNIEPPESMHNRKLEELIVHLGSHPGVTNLGLTKLWKLIYFVDARALRELGEPVTGSDFIKYEHGPVPSRGEKHLRRMTRNGEVTTTQRDVGGKTLNEVKARRTPDLSVFSKVELGVIDAVCAELGRKSATILSDLSHREPSWHYAPMREKLSPELMAYGCEEDAEGL